MKGLVVHFFGIQDSLYGMFVYVCIIKLCLLKKLPFVVTEAPTTVLLQFYRACTHVHVYM